MVIDGHALVHRSYHAFAGQGRTFTVTRTGEIVTAVYGFVGILLKALAEVQPDYWAITFDLPVPTFRHKRFAAYKAQRPPTPPELAGQVDRVHHVAGAFGIPIFEAEGYEADDLIGTLSHQAAALDIDTIILTGDTDTLQLVSPQVRVRYQSGVGQLAVYDEKGVRERYNGLSPGQLADHKALVGDKSDNVPGVPGIGEKTAAKLLQEFGSLESILSRLDEVKPERIRALLAEHKEQALESKRLCTIFTNAPATFDPDRCSVQRYDRATVVELFRDLEFASMISRIPERLGAPPEGSPPLGAEADAVDGAYQVVDTLAKLESVAREAASASRLALDVESTSLDPMLAELVGVALSTNLGQAWYIPVGHRQGRQVGLEQVRRSLGPVLANETPPKIAHNANYDMMVLAEAGMEVAGLQADTMIVAHLLGYRNVGLKPLALNKLNREMTTIDQLIGTGRKQTTFDHVPIPDAVRYSGADVDMTLQLWDVLRPELEEKRLVRLFAEVEVPLVPVLVRMQRNGITLDTSILARLAHEMGEHIMDLEGRIYDSVGHRFNIASPQQLSDVLFGELRLLEWFKENDLPRPRRTQGGYSTDAQVLENLKGAHPMVELILEYRQLTKLKSTYVDSLPALVNPRTGRLHTSFNQTGAVTGRLSSSDPNLQNIPVRTELGRQIRRAFVAPGAPAWQLLSADYSQIELRILAHLCQDQRLMEAFHRGEDIHAATASQVFSVSLKEVTPEQRRFAKVVNFGILYGMSEFGLAQRSDLSREEAGPIIKAYFERYPGIMRYLEETKRKARELGYVETILGRRREIPEINSSNRQVQQAAERMAVNMPIQGTAADIIKIAMVQLQQRMDALRMRSKMLLQVHDELIFEVPEAETEAMKALVQELMPAAIPMSVPLKVDMKMGTSWGDLE
ncbi:MAG: DNA polymerase I [Chloroflexi bacterium]|nr:DNA polymerase I [Chloroflexota bacterium]